MWKEHPYGVGCCHYPYTPHISEYVSVLNIAVNGVTWGMVGSWGKMTCYIAGLQIGCKKEERRGKKVCEK